MDELQKSAIRLKHWIEHNRDHLKGYREVASALEKESVPDASESIRKGIQLIEQANAMFEAALAALPEGTGGPVEGGHTHGHSH